MLIEKEKLEEAKMKIGDRNAELIAEILGIEDYDERNMRACCPFHNEDTPSFIYNKKAFNFKCFGCGASVDLVNALIMSGMTFIEACEKIFEYADIPFEHSERNVKTKRNYRYPKEEHGDIETMKTYLNRRGISNDTIEYLGITADSRGNIAFNYRDENDVLTMVKYRLSRKPENGESKSWCQKGSDTCNILYNMNKVNTTMPLLIVEGEGDVASSIEAGWFNVVSIPLGCQNTHWIDECYEWLMQFPEIIISFDNDDPGVKARKNVIDRLGGAKCRYIEYPKEFIKVKDDGTRLNIPIKDMNDMIQMFDLSYIMNMIINAKEVPVDTVIDVFDVEEVDVHEMEGVLSGIKPIDDAIESFVFSSVNLISAKSGCGKTSLIDQIVLNSADSGHKVFMYSQEMSNGMTKNWLNLIAAGRRNLKECVSRKGKKFYVATDAAQKKIKNKYSGMIHTYRGDESNDADKLFKTMEACAVRKGCKVFVIDNLMCVNLNCSETEKNQRQTDFMNNLIAFSKKFNVCVFLICHLRKSQGGIGGDDLDNIAGTSNLANLTMRSIHLKRISDKEKEDPKYKYRKYNVVLTINKDRFSSATGTEIPLYYDLMSRRFYTDYEEFDKQYAWDDNCYTNEIHCPTEFKTPFE